jgi:hypothetical protein
MQAPQLLSVRLEPIVIDTPLLLNNLVQSTPLFTPDQIQALTSDQNAVITSTTGSSWCELNTWLDWPAKAHDATWVCRSSQLTITLPAARSDAQVLPLSSGYPTAALALPSGPLPLTASVDSSGLRLVAPIGADVAGQSLYDALIGVLTASGGATLTVSCAHDVTVQTPAPPPPPPPPTDPVDVPDPSELPPGRMHKLPYLPLEAQSLRVAPLADSAAVTAEPVAAAVTAEEPVAAAVTAEEPVAAAVTAEEPVAAAPALASLAIDRNALLRIDRPDWGRLWEPPPRTSTTSVQTTVVRADTATLTSHGRDDADAFPDVAHASTNGWMQITPASGTGSLYCKPGERPELFYYLPTEYRLGFHADDATDAPTLPFRVTWSRDSNGTATVAVQLVAMPVLDDGDRATLRSFLRNHPLASAPDYVELVPAATLTASFQGEFIPSDGPLATTIVPNLSGADTSDLLDISFTMPQQYYGVFVTLMQAGIRGRVTLSDGAGLTVAVPVSLDLANVVTNAIAAGATAPSGTSTTGTVTLTNRLTDPVSLDALGLDVAYVGPQSGIVFDAQHVELLPPSQTIAPGATVTLPFTPTIAQATRLAVTPGVVTVHGPSPSDWINTVNRESPQAPKLTVKLTPFVPDVTRVPAAATVQALAATVYAAGATVAQQGPMPLPLGTDTPLDIDLTLVQLAGLGDGSTDVFLEYVSLFTDGSQSLPQRLALTLTQTALILPALLEVPGATFVVTSGTPSSFTNQHDAEVFIDGLRAAGKTWTVDTVAAAPSPPAPSPPAAPAASSPAPTG